jgi:hypothetical protein
VKIGHRVVKPGTKIRITPQTFKQYAAAIDTFMSVGTLILQVPKRRQAAWDEAVAVAKPRAAFVIKEESEKLPEVVEAAPVEPVVVTPPKEIEEKEEEPAPPSSEKSELEGALELLSDEPEPLVETPVEEEKVTTNVVKKEDEEPPKPPAPKPGSSKKTRKGVSSRVKKKVS